MRPPLVLLSVISVATALLMAAAPRTSQRAGDAAPSEQQAQSVSIARKQSFSAQPSGDPSASNDPSLAKPVGVKREQSAALPLLAVCLRRNAEGEYAADQLAASVGASVAFVVDQAIGWHALRFSSPQAAERAVAGLQAHPQVEAVHRQYVFGSRSRTADPLFGVQWHLKNTAQNAGVPGVDLNVEPVWTRGVTGQGVLVAVIDDGVEFTHPDLSPNYQSSFGYDYLQGDTNPSPVNNGEDGDHHGTAVAGLIAARGDNNIGVAGVAHQADFTALRVVGAGQSDAGTAAALYTASRPIDVSNNSWGPQDAYGDRTTYGMYDDPLTSAPLASAAFQNGISQGRSGLGTIYVWAAGNGRQSDNNSNHDGLANLPETIAVTAIDGDGDQSSFAEPGANIMIAAPAGSPGAVTTDRVGAEGYNTGGSVLDDDYAPSFTGTSASTPMLSGVVALMLEANPALTWRDVQHILVRSGRRNDIGDAGWNANGAGYWVNHKYGFGLVDTDVAVGLAESWTNAASRQSVSLPTRTENAPIPDNQLGGITRTISVSQNLFLEHVQVSMRATHSFWGDLDVRLTSPAGSESVLTTAGDVRNDETLDWTYMSVHHWGEQSAGTWTLTISDLQADDSGTLHDWGLILHGTETGTGGMGGTGALPVITTISPSSNVERGTEITLSGNNLANASVSIGGVAQAVQSSSATSLVFIVSSSTPGGDQRVVVTNSIGSANAAITLTPLPPSKKSSGGGGCSLTSSGAGGLMLWLWLLLAIGLLALRSKGAADKPSVISQRALPKLRGA